MAESQDNGPVRSGRWLDAGQLGGVEAWLGGYEASWKRDARDSFDGHALVMIIMYLSGKRARFVTEGRGRSPPLRASHTVDKLITFDFKRKIR
jgi:hypothetical protein